MPSKRKSDTACTNGAKSNGPVTPQGRAISSRNSLRHGLTAKAVVLAVESREEFQALLDDHVNQFQPATAVESSLVQTMAIARWRLNRIAGIEANLFGNAFLRLAGRELQGEEPVARAFRDLADNGKSLAVLLRYESTLTRTYDRALKPLDQLQRARKAAPITAAK